MNDILVDIYKAKDVYSGLGQFSLNFAKELAIQAPIDLKIDFLTHKNQELHFPQNNVKLIQASFQKRYLPNLNTDYNIWHSLHQFPSHLPNKKTKWILTIHDLNFLVEKNDSKKRTYLDRLQKNIDRADCITAISHFTKNQIESNINLKGKEVHVIYNGVDFIQNKNVSPPPFYRGHKFFFSIGIFNQKKNFKSILPIMEKFPDHHLIIAGNNDTKYGKEIDAEVSRLGLSHRVILPGKITDAQKAWLYDNCEAFLFPSLAEGFGMPPIEAMQFGKPVFLSNHTSLPEIGGDVAFYFENFEPNQMADLIQHKLKYFEESQDSITKKIKQHAAQFSWSNSMKCYLELYQSLVR